MMAQKARLFNDEESREAIMAAAHPRDQKALGRRVKNFDAKIWNDNCEKIVLDGNIAKFSQNEKLKKLLLSTYPLTLVEASPDDKIWGIGLDMKSPNLLNEYEWGDNKLGLTLTVVRDLFYMGLIK